MNEHVPNRRATTQAAEGLPRWRWTITELDRMLAAGVIREDDRVELIGGELVPMSPKGPLHEAIKIALADWLSRRLPTELRLGIELGWRPDEDTYCEPDILIIPAGRSPSHVPARDVLLAIEIADLSEDYDLGAKALVYSRLGVRDYWVIRASSLMTRVHREANPEGYGSVQDVPSAISLTSLLLPALSIKLADVVIDRDA